MCYVTCGVILIAGEAGYLLGKEHIGTIGLCIVQ